MATKHDLSLMNVVYFCLKEFIYLFFLIDKNTSVEIIA